MRIAICCLTLLLSVTSALVSAEPISFQAGAAAVDITPQRFPVSMTGSFRNREATGAHDRLHARCLVLDDGMTRLAITVVDSCLLTQEIFDAAKQMAAAQTPIATQHMLMSATHTHTAPTSVQIGQVHPDLEYVSFLKKQIAKAVVEANARLAPARLGWALGSEPRELGNRRWFVTPAGIKPNPLGYTTDRVQMNPVRDNSVLIRPAGPIDPEVAIVSVQSADAKPLALLANYSLHYVGGIPAGQLSADYFGEFARQIGDRLLADDSFVGIMSNGTSGDVNNYNFRRPRPRAAPFVRVRAVASRLADVAFKAHQTIDHQDQVSLAVIERTLDLGVRRPNTVEVKRATSLLGAAADPKNLNNEELYAQETLRLAEHAPTVTIKLQAMQIGGIAVVAIPCEVFSEIGLAIKSGSPLKPVFTIELANGYHGYLPTPEQHALGGYETWRSGWSYLEEAASTKITATVLEMLDELAASQ